MTRKEYAAGNIGVTFDFVRQVVDHPELVETIPNGFELDFIDKNALSPAKEQRTTKIARYIVQHTFEPVKA